MGRRAAMAAAGWGLAPIYVGQQIAGPGRHAVSGPQGAIDGAHAAALMAGEGFAAGACVYLDLEDGAPLQPPREILVVFRAHLEREQDSWNEHANTSLMRIPPYPRDCLPRALQLMKHRERTSIDTLGRGPRMIFVRQDATRDDRSHCSSAFFS